MRQTPWAVVSLVVLAIVLAVLPVTLLPGGASAVHTVIASIGSIVLLVFALFSLVRDTFTAWQLVSALSLLVVVLSGALLVWRYVEQSRSLTVTDRVKLTSVKGQQAGPERMENGSVAHLAVRVPRPRDRLRLTIGADEVGNGQCAPVSSLRLTGAGIDGHQETRPGREALIGLDRSERRADLKVELKTRSGCLLSLHVTKAVLENH
ncbi:hypothetical protein V1L54_15545 [Streptomyces sp. TRM 70361]|uniref:hypothetical protein n=1 Tax=Streptomyces sp. TRM 70361 TaxID=3116553 RepID=UPI002E7B159C|nr:hypothetical protein [Streptomyces sp. TRM 70361]MEE1940800.1 hypothetical protein [Streptomyces sp. TRM 70361]